MSNQWPLTDVGKVLGQLVRVLAINPLGVCAVHKTSIAMQGRRLEQQERPGQQRVGDDQEQR